MVGGDHPRLLLPAASTGHSRHDMRWPAGLAASPVASRKKG